jgi:hypothetical protein
VAVPEADEVTTVTRETAAEPAAARLALDLVVADVAERSSTLADVQRAARRFTSSALCRRLMHVPAARFVHVHLCAVHGVRPRQLWFLPSTLHRGLVIRRSEFAA